MLGPDIVNRQRRPATLRTVREFNGPGNNGSEIRNGVAHKLKAGDVVVIPAGTGHWFTKIDDHINYLMVRIDPDKVTPLKDEAESKAYLSKPRQRPVTMKRVPVLLSLAPTLLLAAWAVESLVCATSRLVVRKPDVPEAAKDDHRRGPGRGRRGVHAARGQRRRSRRAGAGRNGRSGSGGSACLLPRRGNGRPGDPLRGLAAVADRREEAGTEDSMASETVASRAPSATAP